MSTARYGRWDPLGPQTQRRMTAHNIACIHTMVGSLLGTRNMFRVGGYTGTESHFGLGENAVQGMLQWQDLSYSADANLEGYVDVISLETADYGGSFGTWDTGDAANVPPWNPWQCEEIAKWLEWVTHPRAHASCPSTWVCHSQGIPLEPIMDTRAGRRGVGFHRQGVDPYRCSTCRKWSLSYGKGCPGPRRIYQIPGIINRAKAIRAAGSGGDEDMSAADIVEIKGKLTWLQDRLIQGNPDATTFVVENDPRRGAQYAVLYGDVIHVQSSADLVMLRKTGEVEDRSDQIAMLTEAEWEARCALAYTMGHGVYCGLGDACLATAMMAAHQANPDDN